MSISVFLSSKMLEFRDLREVVRNALQSRGIDGWVFEARAGARPEDVVATSLTALENADIYVGLIGREYGQVTVEEFRRARTLQKPCLIYIRDRTAQRDHELEAFLKSEVYDLKNGVTYRYFDGSLELARQVSDDVMAWLEREHRLMTAEIHEARLAKEEVARRKRRIAYLESSSEHVLPEGGPADYLALQLSGWLGSQAYKVEEHQDQKSGQFEWIVNVPTRRGYDRILLRGIEGEAEVSDVVSVRARVVETHTDEGWLVAARRVSPAARQEAERNKDASRGKVFCYTFDELLDETADFTRYLDWIENEVRQTGVDRYFVPLACNKDELDPLTGKKVGRSYYGAPNGWIDGYIDRWLDDPSKEHISILGEFGTGKTWFILHYAWHILQRYKDAKRRGIERPRLPLVISLRDFAKAVSVESLFSEFFFRKHEIRLPGYSAFEQLNRMGKLLLLFDGFDEMATKVDRQKMINNFWELARVVVPGAKVILTSRAEHFPNSQEERALLSAELQASTATLSFGPPQFEILQLVKFDDEQIKQTLALRTDNVTASKILQHPQLLDLARRPVMIEFVLEALPDIEAGRPADLSRVYFYAVRRKMERDIKAERTFTALPDKLYFLCELSHEMLATSELSLNYRLFPDRLRRIFGPTVRKQRDLDHWHYDMMGQSLLIRDEDGDYRPAHRSLLEFFTAYKFAAQLGALHNDFLDLARARPLPADKQIGESYRWSTYFRQSEDSIVGSYPTLREFAPETFPELRKSFGGERLPEAVALLMQAMVDPIRLVEILRATAGRSVDDIGYTGGNAATLLCRQGRSLSKEDLSGAVLQGAILDHSDLSNANLFKASLREVHLDCVDLRGADLREADLKGSYVRHCRINDATRLDAISVTDDLILVYVGDWAEFLPQGSCLLDAAFRVHTDLGLRCVGGLIDGEPADVGQRLHHGCKVWVHVDRSRRTVDLSWLDFVKTYTARTYITRYYRGVRAVERSVLEELSTITGIEEILRWHPDDYGRLTDQIIATALGLPREERYVEVFEKRISVRDLAEQLANDVSLQFRRYWSLLDLMLSEGVTQGRPRTYPRLLNIIDRPDILEHFGAEDAATLVDKVLIGDLEPATLVQTVTKVEKQRKERGRSARDEDHK